MDRDAPTDALLRAMMRDLGGRPGLEDYAHALAHRYGRLTLARAIREGLAEPEPWTAAVVVSRDGSRRSARTVHLTEAGLRFARTLRPPMPTPRTRRGLPP